MDNDNVNEKNEDISPLEEYGNDNNLELTITTYTDNDGKEVTLNE